MKPIGCHNYFVYIITNYEKTVLYTGVTNDIERRLFEHKTDSESKKLTFAGKYNCTYLVFHEHHFSIEHAIEREKQIKGWTRKKKENLIISFNPEWRFLNNEIREE
jgi:putative endonuclease